MRNVGAFLIYPLQNFDLGLLVENLFACSVELQEIYGSDGIPCVLPEDKLAQPALKRPLSFI